MARDMARRVLQDEISEIRNKMKAEGTDLMQDLPLAEDLFTKK